MLYTESMEIVSPLTAAPEAAKPVQARRSWSQALANRWARPQIDLGLSLGSSALVVTSAHKSFVYPARVAVREGKKRDKAIAYGPQAVEIEGREPEGVRVVRPLSAGVVADGRLASQLLSQALTAAKHGVVSAPRVAVAIPSNLSPVESQTLLATVKAAGAREVYLLEQTLAAAIGAGRDLLQAEGHLVVHLGAGATHVSVVSLASPVLSRSLRVAGDAMNEALCDHVRREHQLLIDDRVAEQIKRDLGSALPPAGESTMTVCGRDLGAGKPSERTINSQEVHAVLAPLLAQIAQEVRWLVAEMPTPLLRDVRDNGVIVSGGLAELRGLPEFLTQQTRLRVQVAASPEEVVSRGLQRLLNDASLRKAVFAQGRAQQPVYEPSVAGGTGLLGALFLTAGLALAVPALPPLPSALSATPQNYLGAALTPHLPVGLLLSGWGEEAPPPSPPTPTMQAGSQSELEAENNRLRKLLKAPLAKPALRPLAADVVARDPRGWMSTLTLNVGRNDSVEVGQAVTDGTNLVGRISRVEANRSQVRLFTDSKAVTAGKVTDKRGSGVVVGLGSETVEMRYLDPDSGVKQGDWVLTSGHDEAFPAGIKLGWVTSVTQPSGQNSFTATVRPGMNVHHLQQVLVLRR